MVRLGLGISGRAHGLETGFSQRGLVGRESARPCRAAGREKNCSDCGEGDNDGEPNVFQGGSGLLTDYSQATQPKFPSRSEERRVGKEVMSYRRSASETGNGR